VACLCSFLGTRGSSARVVLSDTFDSSGHRGISGVVSASWGEIKTRRRVWLRSGLLYFATKAFSRVANTRTHMARFGHTGTIS
jgi:hypothetical protein